jgi:hypothetical protein
MMPLRVKSRKQISILSIPSYQLAVEGPSRRRLVTRTVDTYKLFRVTMFGLLLKTVCLCLCVFSVAGNISQSQPVCSTLVGLAAAKGSQSVFNVYINGEFRPSVSKRTQPVIAPFNGSTVYEVPVCTREEIDEAFDAAKAAQKGWSRTPLWKRAELLKMAAMKLREHADEIAEVC